jgi:hypothetical protein
MTDKISLTSSNGGGQWWKSIAWAAKAFERSGFAVEITRGRLERSALPRLRRRGRCRRLADRRRGDGGEGGRSL